MKNKNFIRKSSRERFVVKKFFPFFELMKNYDRRVSKNNSASRPFKPENRTRKLYNAPLPESEIKIYLSFIPNP